MAPQEIRRLLAGIEGATAEDGRLRDLFLARLDAWPTDDSTADRLLDDLDRLLGAIWFSDPKTHQKVFEAITGLADSVSQLNGMTVNERLAAFGLFELWDASSAEGQAAIRRKLRAV